jgi:hypothetical protein
MLQQAGTHRFKPREERRRTMLQARMRSGSGWCDACILNVSSRGLLVYSDGAADLGSMIELRRGGQLVIATVVWRNNQRIGLCSTDDLDIESIVSNEVAAAAAKACVDADRVERRRRPGESDASRAMGRAMEFAFIAAVAVALAGAVAVSVLQSLTAPMTIITSALDPR